MKKHLKFIALCFSIFSLLRRYYYTILNRGKICSYFSHFTDCQVRLLTSEDAIWMKWEFDACTHRHIFKKCHHIIEIRFEFFNMNWNNNSYITGPCLKECYFGKLWSTIALLIKNMNFISHSKFEIFYEKQLFGPNSVKKYLKLI